MQKKGKNLLLLVIFAVLALSPFGGLAIIFAIAYLFYEMKKSGGETSVFTFQWVQIKQSIRRYWWLILLPLIVVIGQIAIAHYTIPTFNEHVMERVAPMLHAGSLLVVIPQLLLLAFGEELAFRGFAQEKLAGLLSSRSAIIITSLLFAIGHLSAGPLGIVLYDVSFIFIDSILYGLLFLKTKNVYVTTIAHFLANVVGIYIFTL